MTAFFRLLTCCLLLTLPLCASAAQPSPVQAELILEEESIQPGHSFWAAVHLKIDKGWHAYWKNPGDAGIPLQIEWQLPSGFVVNALEWPCPESFISDDLVGIGYQDDVVLLAKITPPAHLDAKTVDIGGQVKWLVCSDATCLPGSQAVNLQVHVSEELAKPATAARTIFLDARAKLPQSEVAMAATQHANAYQLRLPFPDAPENAVFFPEDKNQIIHEKNVKIVKQKDGYAVELKGKEGSKSHAPVKGVLVVETKSGKQSFNVNSPLQATAALFEGGLPLALLFAFIGGAILNLMPCVLPVLSFKILSLVKMAGEKRSVTLLHGLLFTLGVMLSFWLLAGVMFLLRSYGQAVGWGFQLQEPLFVAALATFLFIFALNLLGMFEWGTGVASWAGQKEADSITKHSKIGSILSGVLATAMATPCTGPFLGSAIGYAVTLSHFEALLIFTSMAAGMAAPFLILAVFPSCLRYLPKPGPWMETFKQLMAFILFATILWLVWVFGAETNLLSVISLMVCFLCFAIASWVYGKWCSFSASKLARTYAYAAIVLLLSVGAGTLLTAKQTWSASSQMSNEWEGWEPYSNARIAELQSQGIPVFVDFTAKWCLICQVNHMVLESDDVNKQMADAGVVKMKADWTKNDPEITDALMEFGRNGVPLYVLYSADAQQEPMILPQVLTPETVSEHLEKI